MTERLSMLVVCTEWACDATNAHGSLFLYVCGSCDRMHGSHNMTVGVRAPPGPNNESGKASRQVELVRSFFFGATARPRRRASWGSAMFTTSLFPLQHCMREGFFVECFGSARLLPPHHRSAPTRMTEQHSAFVQPTILVGAAAAARGGKAQRPEQ